MISSVDYNNMLAEWVSSKGFFSEWPACREVFLDKLSEDSPNVVALPILACQVVGGSIVAAVPVAAAWSMLRYAADLFDAVQDGDHLPKNVNDPPSAIEFANGLIFSAFNALATIQAENVVYRLVGSFSGIGGGAKRYSYHPSFHDRHASRSDLCDGGWRDRRIGDTRRIACFSGKLCSVLAAANAKLDD